MNKNNNTKLKLQYKKRQKGKLTTSRLLSAVGKKSRVLNFVRINFLNSISYFMFYSVSLVWNCVVISVNPRRYRYLLPVGTYKAITQPFLLRSTIVEEANKWHLFFVAFCICLCIYSTRTADLCVRKYSTWFHAVYIFYNLAWLSIYRFFYLPYIFRNVYRRSIGV